MFFNRARKNTGKKGLAAMVYVHGGGGFSGNGLSSGLVMSRLAAEKDLVVVSMDYALAPFAKMPSQQHDVIKVLQYITKNADKLGINKDKIAMYGESAGGNFALGALKLLKNEK